MKPRLGWLADPEDADSYSAAETRVLLRAIARRGDVVPLWFAVGSSESPHLWNGIRVFPVPPPSLGSGEFLATLLSQQRPQVLLSNLARSRFPAGFRLLEQRPAGFAWVHRIDPEDNTGGAVSAASLVLAGSEAPPAGPRWPRVMAVPYLHGMGQAGADGGEPSAVLEQVREAIASAGGLNGGEDDGGAREGRAGLARGAAQRHVVMRQQLFCNASLAHVMFELTNSLIEMGVPTVPQEEHLMFSKAWVRPEPELLRAGAPAKCERIARHLDDRYDPEEAVVVHFSILSDRAGSTRFGVFQSLTPHEVLYTTGNHGMTPDGVRQLTEAFEKVLAPSEHVLRPYIEAGLPRGCGVVIPHGIDPATFCPEAQPLAYKTERRFRFVQTSFPWVTEKGFDLSISAFCRAFSAKEDAALVLRTPRIRDPGHRAATFGRLEAMVKQAASKPGAPEILLLESDVPLGRRGGIYTGADCYLFPLRAEGFGMTILEAMACGLPVIATPWSGPADFLSPRYTYTLRHSNPVPERSRDGRLLRWHVEPDMEHLVHLMRHVYGHRDEAKAMGLAASRAARAGWTWRQAAGKLAAVLGVRAEAAPGFGMVAEHGQKTSAREG